jgi:hypothetical protein
MFAGMSYVLEEALVEVYSERGWSLRDEHAMATDLCRNPAERAALLPDLRVLHDRLEQVLDRKGYGKEIHANAAVSHALRSCRVDRPARNIRGSQSQSKTQGTRPACLLVC